MESKVYSNGLILGPRQMEFMRDLEKLPPNVGQGLQHERFKHPVFPMGSRKATIFALNTKQKGGPQLETLT